jgi:hypothetical protein
MAVQTMVLAYFRNVIFSCVYLLLGESCLKKEPALGTPVLWVVLARWTVSEPATTHEKQCAEPAQQRGAGGFRDDVVLKVGGLELSGVEGKKAGLVDATISNTHVAASIVCAAERELVTSTEQL